MGDRLLVEDPKLSSQHAQTVRKSRLCAQVVNYFTFFQSPFPCEEVVTLLYSRNILNATPKEREHSVPRE